MNRVLIWFSAWHCDWGFLNSSVLEGADILRCIMNQDAPHTNQTCLATVLWARAGKAMIEARMRSKPQSRTGTRRTPTISADSLQTSSAIPADSPNTPSHDII